MGKAKKVLCATAVAATTGAAAVVAIPLALIAVKLAILSAAMKGAALGVTWTAGKVLNASESTVAYLKKKGAS